MVVMVVVLRYYLGLGERRCLHQGLVLVCLERTQRGLASMVCTCSMACSCCSVRGCPGTMANEGGGIMRGGARMMLGLGPKFCGMTSVGVPGVVLCWSARGHWDQVVAVGAGVVMFALPLDSLGRICGRDSLMFETNQRGRDSLRWLG